MAFYTNVSVFKNDILVRGVSDDGKRIKRKVPYKPYLFVPSTADAAGYKSLQGKALGKVEFETIREAREFQRKYENVEGFDIYGLGNFVYTYIYDNFPGDMQYDVSNINLANIDIETRSDTGFPNIEEADMEITSICIKSKQQVVVLACGDFETDREDVQYIKCKSEIILLQKFIKVWQAFDPDVVTGWNIEFFDMPYLINRIRRILGEEVCRSISPWNIIEERKVNLAGQERQTYIPLGISVLDYLQLYRKFTYTQQESYSLDYIGNVEVGEKKLDYSEYDSLNTLYKENHQKFIEYNIRDVELVERIDDKMKLLEQVYAIAYDAKSNYADALTSVRMWDIITHNHLMDKDICVPYIDRAQLAQRQKERQVEGAYVKQPRPGKYDWVVSFDLNSLYPHLIMQYNISPETFVEVEPGISPHTIIGEGLKSDQKTKMNDHNLSIGGSGAMYTRDYQGFLPALMEKVYNDRVLWKKRLIQYYKEYETNPTPELEKKISQANNMQMAKKIQLNSAYGALGNIYFRWFDIRFAESITLSGQLSIRWIEKKVNEYLNKLLKTEDEDYVIAVDTDSIYLTLDKLVCEVYPEGSGRQKIVDFLDKVSSEKLEPYIEKCYMELAELVNAYSQKMIMKRECIADKGIWTAKKRYALNVWDNEGVRYKEPHQKIMGLEVVRSSTPSSCREAIRKALVLMLNEDNDALVDFIEQFQKEFRNLPYEEIAFPRGCRYLNKYRDGTGYKKGTPIHVRGALTFNKLLDEHKLTGKYPYIFDGDKIKFCYLKLPNPSRENVISVSNTLPRQFNLHDYIDYDTQFEKSFLEPLKNITTVMDWKLDRQKTLEDFWT